jgi:hypothetical protein
MMTEAEVNLLRPEIAGLLRKVPESWAEFASDSLTSIHADALFLLTAAGLVARRIWVRAKMANHDTCFQWRFQVTGEGGYAKVAEEVAPVLYETWADAWRKWRAGETRDCCPFIITGIEPQEWRLTKRGIRSRDFIGDSELPRPAVEGYGGILEIWKLGRIAPSVKDAGGWDWPDGADSFKKAFSTTATPLLGRLVAPSKREPAGPDS